MLIKAARTAHASRSSMRRRRLQLRRFSDARRLLFEPLEDRRLLAIDFGDAPDSYKTLDASGGPKHEIGALFLGTYIDGEPDGYPDQFAEDDDDDQLPNDEDGLVRTSQFIIGQLSSIDVFASAAGKLDAWMDLNGNGQFDHPDEHINDGVSASLNPGVNTLTFTIPGGEEGAVAGTSFARLRISSAGGLAPGGSAADGEVEDYEVQILGGGFGTERDYGDAPNSYQTLAQSSGPSHLITSLFLGNYVDGESNGTPDQFAESDDDDRIPNDEDGLVGSSLFVPGQSASINVRASGSGQVDAWIDYNLNGQFDHPSEHIGGGTSASVTAGVNTINFSIPATATAGNSFARIRLSSAGSLFPLGQASDGEVEDYEVIVFGQTSNQFDFGDAPDSYQTLNTSGGAKHQLGGGLYLGALVDGEPDGSPATDAEGDAFEQFPNDEDGVVRTSLFVAGQSASIDVIASASGKLDAWLDLNGNGQFDHPDEHIDDGTSVPVNAGLNTINFDIPVNAIAGETYARVRISTTGNLGPAGQAADGEVEDYRLVVLSGNGGGGGGGAVQIIDDGDAGFTQTGFAPFAVGYQGDEHFVAAGNGSATASWTFEVTPGRYRVSSTWDPHANRASNVPYTIMDGTTQVAQVAVSQETAPNDLTDAGGNWEDVATVDITSTTLKVMISNDANEFVFADAVRIERVGSLVMEPEIQVLDGATDIADGGTINFGTTTPNTPVDKVLTVKNVGTENLTMTPLNGGNFPNGFSLVQNFGSPTLSPNQSTTFTVRLSSASESNFGGAINFANNDGDENPFDLNLQGVVANVPPPPPTPVVQIIDDGDAGFSSSGMSVANVGFEGDVRFAAAGNGSAIANWTFDVTPGRYRVSTTWVPHANRASNAPYDIFSGNTEVGFPDINQEVAPNDFTDAGVAWEDLGIFDIADTTLTVTLDNEANEYVIADAVRIERVGSLVMEPEIQVLDGATDIADGGTINFGTTTPNTPVDKVLTVKNVGTENLTMTPLNGGNFPNGFSLVQNFGSPTLSPNQSTTFTVRLSSASESNFGGAINFANNDGDENPFDLNLQGVVANVPPPPPTPVVQIIDDGDAGFTQTGFAPFAVGYQGDEHFVAAGNGSATASWTFEVTPGRYRVSSTWDPHANRASNVPYTIMDGTTQVAQVAVSQETAPNDLTDAGGNWEDVATVDITSTTLKVMISNDANEFVFADAVRIERVGSLVMEPEIQVLDGATDIADGGTINFGTTTPNTPVDKVLTVKNVGTENLTMTPLNGGNFPNGFSLVQNFGSPTLSPNQSTTFTVRLSSASESNFGGAINFANNDGDENPFDLNLQGVVANVPPPPPTPVVQIIDDGDAGFTQTGFAPFAVGYQGDEHFVAAGNGSATASWTFDVTPGRYRVSSTWDPHANRADNVPYTILDGTTQVASVAVNQEVAPNDFTDAGGDWEDVATVDIFDTTLKVMLTNDANEYVFADAVRIERNGDITQIPGSPSAPANSNIPDVTLPAPDANEFIDSGGIQISTRTIGVIFESNATVGDVNDLISSIDATIVGGQSSTKLLFLALPPSNTLENVVSAIVSLNNDARVVVATPNTLQTTRQLSNNSDQFARGWVWETTPNGGNNGLELIRAPQAWNLQTYGARNGDVADVGVIDSSFDPTHPDLAGRLQVPPSTPAQLTVTCPMGISAPCISEHGTHVTGIIAAQGDNPLGVEGVAPHNPNIIGRVANVATLQTIQTIYSILAENRDVVAINMSFGLKEYAANINPQTDNVRDPIPFTYSQMMFLAGIAHNTAAANFIAANARSNFLLPSAVGYDARPGVVRVQDDSGMNSAAILNPSGHYIAVEAVNQSNSNPTGTNLGGTISAPGIGIRSTESTSAGDYDRSATGTSDGDPNYATISGTSQATPHVTGLISYLWHLAPDLTFDQVRDLVTHSDFTVQTNNGTQPRIDAFAAVMGIDQKKSNFTLQKALVDVDDGSLDGNARNDVDDEDGDGNTLESFVSGNVAGVDATGIKHGDGLRGDGVVDMKDFRAFRDAMLQVLLSENSLSSSDLDLDGAAGSLKRDLNLDGRVNLVPTTSDPPYENVFPRYDFNGSGAMEADGILVTPGSTGVAPFKIDPDTSCSNLNSPAGCLRDIDVLANPAIWQVDQEGVSTTDLLADRDNDETIDYLYSADFHFNIGPDPQANSADLSIQVESLQGGPNGAVTWSKTINIPGPLSAQNATKRIITVPLFGDRVDNAVKVTVARGGGSGSFTFGAVQYGKDRVVRVEN